MRGLTREQKICISCGFCCDGTLFDKAILQPEERNSLPPAMKANCSTKNKREFFILPCPFFNNFCTVYSSPRLYICSAFRCRLLTDLEKQIITRDVAYSIISGAKSELQTIAALAHDLLLQTERLSFREIQEELNYALEHEPDERKKMLAARCTIMTALLSRHFKQENDFNSMLSHEQQVASTC